MIKCWACGTMNPDDMKLCYSCKRDLGGPEAEAKRQTRRKAQRKKRRS